ncbi:MAG: CotH kinase family protein [Muribaculaceae bacterium]|nr:CotH kinase family protein [Muribaculaceae bacterium]
MNYIFSRVARATLAALSALVPAACMADDYPQLSDLPTVYVETENNAPITSKEDYIRATLRYVDADGIKVYDALGIRGRGNSTWGLEKKPYRIKFDKKQEFLGPDRAKAKSWTLLANHADKTLIRNAVAACIGEFAGQPFTAAAQFVDLVVNGSYLGNYQISDQMEVREKRVDIIEQEDPMTDDSDISGGYFLEVDGFADSEPAYFTTARGVKVTIKSPDDKIIDKRQIEYIRNHMNKFENALFSDNFTDPDAGYRQYVDSLTLASWYVASELTGNVDCFWSTYMYKQKGDDRFYWGPLWDYDIAFNNCDRVGDVSRELMVNKGFGDDLTKIWVNRMWQDPWFVELINRTWQQLVEAGIEDHVKGYIDDVAARIEQSQKLNFASWPINSHVYNELVLFSTYSQGIAYLKKFISDHVEYLTDTFASAARGDGQASVPTMVFRGDAEAYYLLTNYGSGLHADADGDVLVVNRRDEERESQHWVLDGCGDGWYRILNRANGMAITDVAQKSGRGGAYQTGSQLALREQDGGDQAQEWQPVPLKGGCYALVNRKTSLAWNNSGGAATDGTPVISWTNDSQNVDKPTRQWLLEKDARRDTDGVAETGAEMEYMVTYSPAEGMLRFRCGEGSLPKGDVTVWNAAGQTVWHGAVAAEISVSALPAGMYVVCWNGGSARFVR